jgi:hypothetical protein
MNWRRVDANKVWNDSCAWLDEGSYTGVIYYNKGAENPEVAGRIYLTSLFSRYCNEEGCGNETGDCEY